MDRLQSDCSLERPTARYLAVQAELFLVACSADRVIATVMAGYDGHRGWINYLAVHPEHRRVGSGNTAVIDFYKRIGFKVDEVISLGKRFEADDVG